MSIMRLDKFLSNEKCGTRTEVKQLLKKKLVSVNGEIVQKPEMKIDTLKDEVICQGKMIRREEYVYYMLNKPAGYLSATEDRFQKVVTDLIREPKKSELFPVGRLDIDTEGLLLLTNDGQLAHDLLAPAKHVDKTYFARIRGLVEEDDIQAFQQGIDIGEKRLCQPAILKVEKADEEGCEVLVTIREGKFHQIKRMFETRGKRVLYLKRMTMGSLILDPELESGKYRRLTEEEIEGLKQHVNR